MLVLFSCGYVVCFIFFVFKNVIFLKFEDNVFCLENGMGKLLLNGIVGFECLKLSWNVVGLKIFEWENGLNNVNLKYNMIKIFLFWLFDDVDILFFL